MALDVSRTIGAVTRTLASREVGEAPARVIVAARDYRAAPEELWDALTNPARIPRWFLPVSGDLRPGGRYQLEGNAGGEILACEAPRRLSVTWEMHGQASRVVVRLAPAAGGGTRLELEHTAHVPAEFWDRFGPGAVGVGWDQALFGLDQHFVTGSAVRPEHAMQWVASDEGRRFVRESSDAWCAASIAAGTEPGAAAAAAARTVAAYTGEASPDDAAAVEG